jgi:hypothetical protein
MNQRELYLDRRTGKVCTYRLERETGFPLYEGERVAVEISAGLSFQNVLVTEDVERGRRYLVYTSAHPPYDHFLCAAASWREGRFARYDESARRCPDCGCVTPLHPDGRPPQGELHGANCLRLQQVPTNHSGRPR